MAQPGLIQAAEAINTLYGQMNSSLMPAGEALDQFHSETIAQQIRTRTGLPLSADTIGHLADTMLQPQRTIIPTELAAAAAHAAVNEGAAEAQVAAHFGLRDGFGAMTGVVRELVAAVGSLNLNPTEAAALATQVQAGQGDIVIAGLIAQQQAPSAASRFVNTVQGLRPQTMAQTTFIHRW